MKKNRYSINLIGGFFCFFLLSFFSFQSNAYAAPSSYYSTVQKCYIGYYQRPADPEGLIYWADRLDRRGGNLNEIIEAFANSAEAQTFYGTINSSNISTIVNGIYNALFGRNAETGGLNYYVNGFNSGQFTAATIMLNVLNGAQNEDFQSVNNKVTASNFFTKTIDPELDGLNFQVTYAGDGDVIPGRNFLTLYATSVKVPSQCETTEYIRAYIANPGDPIMNTFAQSDLTGTWNFQILETGSSNGWMRGIATADSSGFLTISSVLDSSGSTGLPPAGSIQWTINGCGVVSESGINSADHVHNTMTSNKNFIAGTGTNGDGYQLRIAQKVVPGTVYSNADLQNKSFVFHQLTIGTNSYWEYGAGTTDATGLVTISNATAPSGPRTTGTTGDRLSVDGNGFVTSSTDTSFHGFLSADKKTILRTATYTDSGNQSYALMIIQITGQTYTAGPLPAGTSAAHLLGGGSAPAPFWIHYTSTVASGGGITISDWMASNPAIVPSTTPLTGSISSSGTVTVAGNASYHGQVSHDGKFTVATQTSGTNIYMLLVNTR